MVNVFLIAAPLRGWRTVGVSKQGARLGVAAWIRDFVYVPFAGAERIVLVLDHLNTHSPASLSAAFLPAEAKRLAAKPEVHHSPAHLWRTISPGLRPGICMS